MVVSSTVFPPKARSKSVVKSVYSGERRLEQTRESIESLRACGYETIFLLDNSGHRYEAQLHGAFPGVNVSCFDHYQYDNKGISESFLLLEGLKLLPEAMPIVKISGRYRISRPLELDASRFDLAARIYDHPRPLFRAKRTMSTRCYIVRNKEVFAAYLLALLNEIFAQSSRIVGPGSLRRFLVNQLGGRSEYCYFDPNLSVESASVAVVERLGLRLHRLDSIGLTGMASTFENLRIED